MGALYFPIIDSVSTPEVIDALFSWCLQAHHVVQCLLMQEFFCNRCADNNGDQASFQALVDELLKNKTYPKIEEYYKRQQRLEIKKKFIEGMSVEEFLDYFEDPEKVSF